MSSPQRAANIHIRARESDRALIDRAAERLGKTRSEFILDIARREAAEVLRDERSFALSPEAWAAFVTDLDRPPRENPGLKSLFARKAPWDNAD
jgi:uncharacterized protein (DUF1778 family)